jgi:type III secretion system low calcium response chaperone LcrH/SycD
MKLKELIARLSANRQEDFPFPDNLEEYLEDFIPNTLLKSETLQKAFGVSNYEMEEIYKEAYDQYQDDCYLESATHFRWLVLLNPFVSKYWNGLAASLQLLAKHEKALHAYAMVALLEKDNPYPHFRAYECYEKMGNPEEGAKALELAYQRAKSEEKHRELQTEIEQLRSYLCLSHASNPL